MKDVIATWSGGKDSCFAAHIMMQRGYSISCLVNTVSEEYNRVRFHGIKAEYIQMQAHAIGTPLLQRATSGEHYDSEFKELLHQAIRQYHSRGIVFGDIHLEDCYGWAQAICIENELQFFEPLWRRAPKKILEEFVGLGFEAIIVSVQANLLSKEWVGRVIDHEFISDIQKLPHIDMCGENGEFHTFVVDGPLFKKKLQIQKFKTIERDGYYFLDIQEISIKK